MAYKVIYTSGKGKERTYIESIPFQNKKRVEEHIRKRGYLNTKISIVNTKTMKSTDRKSGILFTKDPFTKKYRF